MNRTILIALLFIFKLNVYSQNKFYTSIDVSPLLSYRSYKLTNHNSESPTTPSGKEIFDNFENVYDSIESSKFGYQVAVNIGYCITNRIIIQSGIQYKNIGLELNQNFPTGQYEIDGVLLPVSNESYEIESVSKINYLGIPLIVRYILYSHNNFDLSLMIGTTFDFLMSHQTEEVRMYESSPTREDYSQYPLFNMNLNGGILINYNINNKIKIYLNPLYTKYITPNIKYEFDLSDELFANINQYYFYGEIKVGVSYMF